MIKKYITFLSLLTVFFCGQAMAYNGFSAEPNSGGRFFRSKGTKASEDYLEYGRTGKPVYRYGDGINIGPANFKPVAEYTREWDNNIYLTDENEKSDWINRLILGGAGDLVMDEGKYVLHGAGYDESEWFVHHDDQDHSDYTYEGGAEMNMNNFSLFVEDQFRRTTERSGNEFESRVSRKENTLRGLLEVPFSQFFVETEVVDFDIDYRLPENRGLNRNDLSFYPRVGMDIGDRTQALFEYAYTHISYSKSDRDGDSNAPSLGLRGLITERIAYQVWGGWEFRKYDRREASDYYGFITRGQLRWDPSELTQFFVNMHRRPVESVYANQTFYAQNELDLVWRRQLMERLFFSLRGLFQWNDYPNGRADWVMDPGARIEYLLPYDIASLVTEYRVTGRSSNKEPYDYDRQIFNFGVRTEF